MNIAFYAPMKSPYHSRPSGDRQIARNIILALEHANHTINVASQLRAWEGRGDQNKQADIRTRAEEEVEKLIKEFTAGTSPDIWLTYHCYHKAPDWIGPVICQRLQIPYGLIEASYAPLQQKSGLWAEGLEQTRQAIESAGLLININRADIQALSKIAQLKSKMMYLPPFIDTKAVDLALAQFDKQSWCKAHAIDGNVPTLITVAMMRKDAKLQSYRMLAKALRKIADLKWQLLIAGDGPAEEQVRDLFAGINEDKVSFLGRLASKEVFLAMRASDVLVWPGINEALGIVYLEAQACGLPVIAGEMPGSKDMVLARGIGCLIERIDEHKLADRIAKALKGISKASPENGSQYRKYVARNHSLASASIELSQVLTQISHL